MGKKKRKLFYSIIATVAVFILPLVAVKVLMKKPVNLKVYRLSQEYVLEKCAGMNIEFPEYDPTFVSVDETGKLYTISAFVNIIKDDNSKEKLEYKCKLIDQSGNCWLLSDLDM